MIMVMVMVMVMTMVMAMAMLMFMPMVVLMDLRISRSFHLDFCVWIFGSRDPSVLFSVLGS